MRKMFKINKAIMAKKGIFFTLMASFILVLIILALSIPESQNNRIKTMDVSRRVYSINYFIQDIKDDMERVTSIIGFRSLLGIEQRIIETGQYADHVESRVFEVLVNGTYNGTIVNIMENATFNDWVSKIKNKGMDIGIIIDINITGFRLYHIDPWTVEFWMNISLNISDMKNTASWYQEKTITKTMGIQNFEDPLYVINSYGRVSAYIIKSNLSFFVNTSNNDTSNLKSFINQSLYINSTRGPSFLMRLAGNTSASEYGIESLVDLSKFIVQEVDIFDRSTVDWRYFSASGIQPIRIHNISDVVGWTWFRLDNESLTLYDCDGLVIP